MESTRQAFAAGGEPPPTPQPTVNPMTRPEAQIAVVMLCHKNPEHALGAIASMENERHLIEQVYLGDNSCDPGVTAALQSSDLDFEHVVFDINNGFAGGMNALMSIAVAESGASYLLVLNDDTVLEPACLAKLLEAAGPDVVVSPMIVSHQDQSTVIQNAGSFNRDLVRVDNRFAGTHRSQVDPGIYEVEMTDGCCFLIHRQWPDGGFLLDADLFLYYEDVEYFLRLRDENVRFFFASEAVIQHKKFGSTGDPGTPSAVREYYFYRNRLILAQRLHSGRKRWQVYVTILRLAAKKWLTLRKPHPEAAKGIALGASDFFRGRRGPRLDLRN